MPAWLSDAVFYEIYPQSFYDTDADGIGDLRGVIRKLDYIAELGCNAIWLNPCFLSPFHDAGYDVADYYRVAPRYGNNEDLRELFVQAHSRGMRVLLDLVAGHTSVEHAWFRQSMESAPNAYSGRYIWSDDPWETFEGVANVRGGINGFCQRGACAVNFYSTQPSLNYGFAKVDKPWQSAVDSPEAVATKEALKAVMRFWLAMGCDGFRVDMAGSLVKADPDESATAALWRELNGFVAAEYPDAAMVAEWGNPERALAGGFHMDFLLHFGPSRYLELFRENPYFSRAGGGDIAAFTERYRESRRLAGDNGLICIPSGNHDMQRIAWKLSQEELKVAFAFLLSMPGVPFIYYGDEIGMRYLEDIPSVEGGYERTGARSPMQWDDTLNAGFSSATPEQLYIPIDPGADRPTVKGQMADPGSLWREVQKLIAVRKANEPLQGCGGIEFLCCESGACPYVYRRTGREGEILVALNPSGKVAECEIVVKTARGVLYEHGGAATLVDGRLTVPPGSASFLKIK